MVSTNANEEGNKTQTKEEENNLLMESVPGCLQSCTISCVAVRLGVVEV